MKKILFFIGALLFGVNAYASGDLTVNGALNVGNGGIKFSDGSIQTTAKWPTKLSAKGSTTLPNGMVLQWGEFVMGTGWNNVQFDTTFPNACLNVQVTIQTPDDAYPQAANLPPTLRAISKTGFELGVYGSYGNTWRMMWTAIGY